VAEMKKNKSKGCEIVLFYVLIALAGLLSVGAIVVFAYLRRKKEKKTTRHISNEENMQLLELLKSYAALRNATKNLQRGHK